MTLSPPVYCRRTVFTTTYDPGCCLVCLFLFSRYSRTVSLLLFKCTVVLLIVEACKFLYSFSPALRGRRKKEGGL